METEWLSVTVLAHYVSFSLARVLFYVSEINSLLAVCVCVCKYTHLCVLGAEGNAPLGHTLTDSATTALILIITGREETHTHICTYTHKHNDSRDFTTVSLFSNSTLSLTMNSCTTLIIKPYVEDSQCIY